MAENFEGVSGKFRWKRGLAEAVANFIGYVTI
jgi:hypothetical protein